MTTLMQFLWPVVALCYGGFVFAGFTLWLRRDERTVRDLKRELGEMQSDWTHKFAAFEQQHELRIAAIERRVNAMQPSPNPLGSHYSTRRPG
jgi:hypothetical protein